MLNKLPQELNQRDRLLFYFSGHGDDLVGANAGYMLFSQAVPGDFADHVLPISEVETWASVLPCNHMLFLFDCCASGAGLSLKGERTERQLLSDVYRSRRNCTVITAATGTQEALSTRFGGEERSIFTYYLLRALRDVDAENWANGVLTIEELFGTVHQNVTLKARQLRARQIPDIKRVSLGGEPGGTFFFVNPNLGNTTVRDADPLGLQTTAKLGVTNPPPSIGPVVRCEDAVVSTCVEPQLVEILIENRTSHTFANTRLVFDSPYTSSFDLGDVTPNEIRSLFLPVRFSSAGTYELAPRLRVDGGREQALPTFEVEVFDTPLELTAPVSVEETQSTRSVITVRVQNPSSVAQTGKLLLRVGGTVYPIRRDTRDRTLLAPTTREWELGFVGPGMTFEKSIDLAGGGVGFRTLDWELRTCSEIVRAETVLATYPDEYVAIETFRRDGPPAGRGDIEGFSVKLTNKGDRAVQGVELRLKVPVTFEWVRGDFESELAGEWRVSQPVAIAPKEERVFKFRCRFRSSFPTPIRAQATWTTEAGHQRGDVKMIPLPGP